ncbi:MAG: hypothetical protein A3I89_02180 [Candidatus Harrisonbacteria bacterium RIFCSPLOWO2_02_FULL_41_11]|uniref:Uncharacterized protein n=1 Tax=Candidatus Harrisonbacteria bacterium RIFCSPHIGHO2_02_FULL_42_16 TaxID=1798404 RepID=A0A1G1ZLD9_9BACT|nr:MAG: hypothetical protein A3B92_00105 [Candidatus Harrisonbacteria bacterium RIFCSPHIGHO2_02_FULL_42_16]OGY67543.1 MAG: hypothetical protein A3I89_02180 [Candidatus Harrisonbacteria bacterium RIFCSPLOWO2_02_FULL_41_11]
MAKRPPYPKIKTCSCTEEPKWSWEDDVWGCMGCGMVLDKSGKKLKAGKCCYECKCEFFTVGKCTHCRKRKTAHKKNALFLK